MDQDPKLLAEVAAALKAIREEQEFTHGQVQALRVALSMSFRAVQASAEFRALVESSLEARLQLMKTHGDSQPTIEGYESTLRELLLGFHFQNPADTSH